MGGQQGELSGPDLEQGIPLSAVPDGGVLLGHAAGEPVVLAREGDEVFAVAANCTHYGGPLAEGIVSGETIRCPWHHACFSLRTGEALGAPALNPISCYRIVRRAGNVHVTGKLESEPTVRAFRGPAASVLIVGGGAAGHAAAEMLRREGYSGEITMLVGEDAGPYDRPNLSKDYLAGTAPEEWIPLRPLEYFQERGIDVRLNTRVTSIDVAGRKVATEGGKTFGYEALLLATGAEPVRLAIPGADHPMVCYLRSLADSRAIIERAKTARRAVVVGASFIGLEVAASLRARGVDVHVVAPESRPLERVMGPAIGEFIRGLHEEHGVVFHLGSGVLAIHGNDVILKTGERLMADLVVCGIGVRPRTELAERAGLLVDRGITVNEYLETSSPGIFAAGDIARWPDPHSGQKIRVEHWVVAQRQGQIAARNMLGQKVKCAVVPFFWSQHYDATISYVGHAEKWDRIDVSGDLKERNAVAAFRSGNKTMAVATVGRDKLSLKAELLFEQRDQDALSRVHA
jgi:NADPH-dependent 2,4-dienoyl-CoA reductase/sulfur reductase-like enzyme/nitrite reductase/ring-hydroxylating ferredoxin subunit